MASKNPFQRTQGGPWIGYVELKKDPITGERKREWFRDVKRKVVVRQMNACKAKVDSGDFIKSNKLTLESYLKTWLEVYCITKAPMTIDGYTSHIKKHIIPSLGKMILSKIKPIHVQEFYNKQTEKGINIRQQHAILRKAFNDAISNELLTRNPCSFVILPEQKEYESNIYTEEEYNKLLKCIKGTKDELVIVLGGMCGLRRSEIMGLRWSDVDLDNNIIHVRQAAVPTSKGIIIKKPKNKTSFRSFIFPSDIKNILKKYQGIGDAYVFPKQDGTPENGGNYSHRFKNLLKKHGLPHIRLHDLRHFTATMLLGHGVDSKIVADFLGHSTPQITQKIYQHVTSKMQQEAADKLNKVLKLS